MGGPKEYRLARMKALVKAFEGMLGKVIELKNTEQGGYTDCTTAIWVNEDSEESYVITEHELSHWLFETDVHLTNVFIDTFVSRLMNRAGVKPGTVNPFETHLKKICFDLWNMLEDHRVCSLWGELYPGGADLLMQLSHDICKYEANPRAKVANILDFLCSEANGVPVPEAPANFQACVQPLQTALGLIELVDAVAGLAITGQLIDDIADELIKFMPPPPKPPSSGRKPQGAKQKRQQAKKKREEEAKKKMQSLCDAVPRRGPHKDSAPQSPIGKKDVTLPEGQRPKSKHGLGSVKKVMKASKDKPEAGGPSPFEQILEAGRKAMAQRIEQAQQAALLNKDAPEQEQKNLLMGSAQLSGIPTVFVQPVKPLPETTAAGEACRRHLSQLRMKKKSRMSFEGDLDAGALLDAIGAGDLGRPFYEEELRVAQFELLFLFDVSGSMIGYELQLVEQALADAVYAVRAIKSKATMWAFSDCIFAFEELGSPVGASGLTHGGTSMVQALEVAHAWGKEAPSRRAIILMTDGLPTSCRVRNSTGDALQDLQEEILGVQKDKIPLAVLAIRQRSMEPETARELFDRAFHQLNYSILGTLDELVVALPNAVRILAEGHLNKRRT